MKTTLAGIAWVLGWSAAFAGACGGSTSEGTPQDGGGGVGGGGQAGGGPGGAAGSPRACTPGAKQGGCACGGGINGYQVCNAQGTSFEGCVCPDASVGGAGGSAGIGGFGGNAGDKPSKPDAGIVKDAGSLTLVCGTTTCTTITGTPIGDIPACCSKNMKCGIIPPALADLGSNCVEENQPGKLDPSCPSAKLAGLLDTPGCCTPTGVCGTFVDVDQLGVKLPLGCVDPASTGITPDGGIRHCLP